MNQRKYHAPTWMLSQVSTETYERWLHRKSMAHIRRDRRRGNTTATNAGYKSAIHEAVLVSDGRDHFTGEVLDWSLISQYRNDDSKRLRRIYKQQFALLPTVDHMNDGIGEADFVICSWRTNDAKGDLDRDDFLALCARVLEHHGYSVSEPEDQ